MSSSSSKSLIYTSTPRTRTVGGPSRATRATPANLGVLGFSRSSAAATPFDDALSKLSDATQVVMCQLVDEIIRDLQGTVSRYHIPAKVSCAQYYAWLDNQAVSTIGKYLDAYQLMLTDLGLGPLPDNTGTQLTALRDGIVSVMRAVFDPVCMNPGTPELTKELIQERLKGMQGMLCAMQPKKAGLGQFPKVMPDPQTGAMTIVTADGNKIKLNLDNSADNSNNLANDGGAGGGGGGGGGGLDPNLLAALLLMRSDSLAATAAPTADPLAVAGIPGMDTTPPPPPPPTEPPTTTTTTTVELDTSLQPTQAPVPTLLGLGPIGITMVAALVIVTGVLLWQMNKGGASSAPAAPAVPAPQFQGGFGQGGFGMPDMGAGMGGGAGGMNPFA